MTYKIIVNFHGVHYFSTDTLIEACVFDVLESFLEHFKASSGYRVVMMSYDENGKIVFDSEKIERSKNE